MAPSAKGYRFASRRRGRVSEWAGVVDEHRCNLCAELGLEDLNVLSAADGKGPAKVEVSEVF